MCICAANDKVILLLKIIEEVGLLKSKVKFVNGTKIFRMGLVD